MRWSGELGRAWPVKTNEASSRSRARIDTSRGTPNPRPRKPPMRSSSHALACASATATTSATRPCGRRVFSQSSPATTMASVVPVRTLLASPLMDATRSRRRAADDRGGSRCRARARRGSAVADEAAELAHAASVVAQRDEQGRLPELGPAHLRDVDLGIRGLPQEEVREPRLAGRADQEVGIGRLGVVEVAPQGLLVDARGIERAALDVAHD